MPAAQSSPTFLPPLHTVQRDAETHSHTPFKNIFELCHCVRDSLLCVLPSLAPACTRPPSCLLFSISPTLTVSFSLSCARHSSVLLDLCLVVVPQCRFLWSALGCLRCISSWALASSVSTRSFLPTSRARFRCPGCVAAPPPSMGPGFVSPPPRSS